jgi:hypothetical protein
MSCPQQRVLAIAGRLIGHPIAVTRPDKGGDRFSWTL